MEAQDKITAHQLLALIFVSLLSPIIRLLPQSSVAIAGHAAWLSVLPAAAAGLVYVCLLGTALRRMPAGTGLWELVEKSIGRTCARVVIAALLLWLVFYTGFLSRSAAERLLSYVYRNSTPTPFILVGLTVSVIAASGSVSALVRTGELFLPIIGLVLVLVLAACAVEVRAEYILPVTIHDTGKIALGALPVIDIIGAWAYFLPLASRVSDRENLVGSPARWLMVELLAVLGVMLVTIGSCAPELTLKYENAFFMAIRNISIAGIAERIEAVIIAVWIITDFTLLAALLMSMGELSVKLLGVRKRRPFPAIYGILAAAIGIFMTDNAFSLELWSTLIIPAVNILLTYILLPAILLVGVLRHKMQSGK